MRPAAIVPAACLALALTAFSQSSPLAIEYRVYGDHPRLLLPAKRARLLQRERERESLRWIQFDLLVSGKARMPETGFALGLYYVASENKDIGRQAVEWALGPATDLRELALVFDWCQPLLSGAEAGRLAEKIHREIQKTAGAEDLPAVRSRVFGAIALSGHLPGIADKYLPPVVEQWWKTVVIEPLEAGRSPIDPRDHYALLELLHALRDNLDVDLRETAAKHFVTMPFFHLMSHYPAPYPAPENDYRIPLMPEHGEPDLREAVRSRAAALAMVAYDNNAQEMQFLQGWLIQDQYLMRSTFGIPYEFLWANPYQPGLSYHYLPNVFHDAKTGRLVIRSTWDEDAVWYYQAGSYLQMFHDGVVINLKQEPLDKPVVMGNTTLLPAPLSSRFAVHTEEPARYYLVGLKPSTKYEIEVDDEQLRELETDRGGVLELNFPRRRNAGVRLRPKP